MADDLIGSDFDFRLLSMLYVCGLEMSVVYAIAMAASQEKFKESLLLKALRFLNMEKITL